MADKTERVVEDIDQIVSKESHTENHSKCGLPIYKQIFFFLFCCEHNGTISKMADKTERLVEDIGENHSKCGLPICERIFFFLFRNYLALGLAFLVIFGVLVPAPGVFLSRFPTHYVCIVGIFFHSGIKLRTGEVKEAVKAYKALILGIICILLMTPIIGVKLTSLLPFDEENHDVVAPENGNSINVTNETTTIHTLEYREGDSILGSVAFRTGIQIYFVVPCTISAGMVMVSFVRNTSN